MAAQTYKLDNTSNRDRSAFRMGIYPLRMAGKFLHCNRNRERLIDCNPLGSLRTVSLRFDLRRLETDTKTVGVRFKIVGNKLWMKPS